nr:RNA-directed DNA polymerase, eukaryota, reverse transcriptase zinc-binding domain protein [Tanacetum cinerariifolium]
MHLHANVVRFERSPLQSSRPSPPNRPSKAGTSYASAAKGILSPPLSASPAMVLDDSCSVNHDLKNYVMGEVKQFSAINNLRVLLSNEGFSYRRIIYLGGQWVMIELPSAKSKSKLMKHVGVASWFKSLSNAQPDFVPRDRRVWVDVEGVPMHVWSQVAERGSYSDGESDKEIGENHSVPFQQFNAENESDSEEIFETVFGDNANELGNDGGSVQKEASHDPFEIYDLLHKKDKAAKIDGSKVKHDWIRELCNKNKISFLSIQETKSDNISDMVIKNIWANSIFETSVSEALGNSGGLLCVWDPYAFHKEHHIIFDNFISLYGTWTSNQTKMLLISVYAPQAVSLKRSLWGYLTTIINRWNGECIVMGDFNKVRRKEDRWGTTFNTYGARVFNQFIASACLVEIQLEGYQSKLRDIDKSLDQGEANDDLLASRMELLNQLHDFKTAETSEYIQKAKIKWAVEGDENSKFFHGMVNQKRANLAVKGVMIDGECVDEPNRVKEEFRDYFAARFNEPGTCHGHINYTFPNHLNEEQPFLILLGSVTSGGRGFGAAYILVWLPSLLMGARLPSSNFIEVLNKEIRWPGGRLTLLKSVLGSTPIYNMSLYKVPKTVLNSMESIRRNFFNGIREGERKIAWVKWTKVLASKKNGGLGVSSFFALNKGLLVKWMWRFLSRDNSLWARFIHASHGSNKLNISASYPSLWSSIIKEVNILKTQDLDFFSHCKIRVGNGSNTSFWKDLWIGDSRLCLAFPRLYALENNKDCTVAVKMNGTFVSSFRRDVRGIFHVKDARILLDDFFLPKADTPTRWVKSIPIKLNIFTWKVSLNRLPARINLFRRAWRLTLLDLYSSSKMVLEGVFYTAWWSIWTYRNHLLFADSKPRKEVIFDDIVSRSFLWCIAKGDNPQPTILITRQFTSTVAGY